MNHANVTNLTDLSQLVLVLLLHILYQDDTLVHLVAECAAGMVGKEESHN